MLTGIGYKPVPNFLINQELPKVLFHQEFFLFHVNFYSANADAATLWCKGILEKLPKQNFIQVHKSVIVNADNIKSIEGNLLHFSNTKNHDECRASYRSDGLDFER